MKHTLIRFVFLLIAVLIINRINIKAQSVNAQQLSFAGGGMSMYFGGATLYSNPAELMNNTFRTGTSVEIGSFSSLLSHPISLKPHIETTLQNALYPILRNSVEPEISSTFRAPSTSLQESSINAFIAGFRFSDWAIGLGARVRNRSFFTQSGSWQSAIPDDNNARFISFETGQWHELTIGFARSMDYLNQLRSNFNHLHVGFSASLLLPYSYERFSLHQIRNNNLLTQSLFLKTGGKSETLYTTANPSIENQYWQLQDVTDLTNLGFNINMGLTYVVPFKSDYTRVYKRKPIQRYWKLSIALTDLGIISFSSGFTKANRLQQTQLPEVTESLNWNGSQLLTLQQRLNLVQSPAVTSLSIRDSLQTIHSFQYLPTKLRSSFLTSFTHFKIGIDINYSVIQAFSQQELLSVIGFTELRALSFIPIRGGIRLNDFRFSYMSLGSGLDLGFLSWDISILYSYNHLVVKEPIALASTGLTIRF